MVSNNTQDYFWTEKWQKGEKAADKDIKEGRILRFSTADACIKYLKSNYEEVLK